MVSIYFRTCSILFYFIFFYTFIFHTFFLFQKIINSHFLIIFPQTNRCTTRSACSSPLNKPTNRWISMDAQKCIDFQLITPDSLPIQSNSTVSFFLFVLFFFSLFVFVYWAICSDSLLFVKKTNFYSTKHSILSIKCSHLGENTEILSINFIVKIFY